MSHFGNTCFMLSKHFHDNIYEIHVTYIHNTSWVLQLCPNQGHMQLVTHELLNPCCFIHLIAKDI